MAFNPAELKDFLAKLRGSALHQQGTFKFHEEDGKPVLHITATSERFEWEGMQTVHDVWESIRGMGLKTREEIHPGLGRKSVDGGHLFPQGWYRYPFLEGLSNIWAEDKTGAFLARESYSNQAHNYDEFERALKLGGIGIVDDDKSTILRMFQTVNGKQEQASFGKVVEFLEKKVGLTIDAGAGDKVYKRLKALTSLRGYGMFEEGVWNIATFDPLDEKGPASALGDLLRHEFGETADIKKLGEQAFEGMSVMRPSAVKQFSENLMNKAAEIEATISGSPTSMHSLEKRRQANKLMDQAIELEKMADKGKGRFNARFMGFDVADGQLKGDILIGSEKFFEKLGDGQRQILTAASNLKKEVSLNRLGGGKGFRFGSLEEHGLRRQVFADIQTLSSMPFAFPQADLDTFMRGTIDKTMMEYLNAPAGSGDVKGFMNALQSVLDKDMPDEVDAARKLGESQKYAHQIIQATQDLDIDVKEHPALLNRFFENYHAWLKHADKSGNPVPHYLLKDTMSAAIADSTSLGMAARRGNKLAGLTSGVLGYEGHSGSFALSTVDIPKYYEIFGGFDSDDYLNVMLRYDTSSRRIRAIAYRQPNALGELGVFDTDSSVLRMFLKDKGVYNHATMNPDLQKRDALLKKLNNINQKIKGVAKDTPGIALSLDKDKEILENELARIDNSLKAGIDELDFSKFGSRIGFDAKFSVTKSGTVLNDVTYSVKNGEGIEMITESAMTDMETSGLRYLRLAKDDTAKKAAYTLESVLKSRENAGLIAGELGKYSNARMLLDTWINANDFHQLEVTTKSNKVQTIMREFRVVTQETAIDSMINAVTGHLKGAFKLSNVTEDIYRSLGREVTLARRGADLDTGLDPYMMRFRISEAGKTSMRAGIKDAFEILEITDEEADVAKLILPDDHAQAFMSRYHLGFEGHLEDIGSEGRAAVERAEYPSYVMDKHLGPEVRKESEKFLEFYDQILRKNLHGIDAGGDMDMAYKQMLDGTDDYSAAFSRIHRESMRYMSDFFEDGAAGTKVHELLQGVMKIAAGPEGAFRWHHGLFQHGRALAEGLEIDDGVDMYQLSTQSLMAAKAEAEGLSKLTDDQRAVLSERHTIEQAMNAAGPEPPGGFRAAMRETADVVSERIIRPFKRVDRAGLDRLWSIDLIKKGTVVAAGLIAFSAVYQHRRGVSPEDMQGPPLLPGGSFYEPPTGPGVPITDYNYSAPSGGGVTYKINARGNHDPSQLMGQISAISGGTVSGSASSAPRRANRSLGDSLEGIF